MTGTAHIWQPIATARRDGTFILARAGHWRPCVVHWATYGGKSKWGSDPETFMEEDHFLSYWLETDYEPTHWMPLPDDDDLDAIETAYRNGFADGEKELAGNYQHSQEYARGLELNLRTAVGHIEHMAAWITKQPAGYSFEGLGEDMPGIKAALAETLPYDFPYTRTFNAIAAATKISGAAISISVHDFQNAWNAERKVSK